MINRVCMKEESAKKFPISQPSYKSEDQTFFKSQSLYGGKAQNCHISDSLYKAEHGIFTSPSNIFSNVTSQKKGPVVNFRIGVRSRFDRDMKHVKRKHNP